MATTKQGAGKISRTRKPSKSSVKVKKTGTLKVSKKQDTGKISTAESKKVTTKELKVQLAELKTRPPEYQDVNSFTPEKPSTWMDKIQKLPRTTKFLIAGLLTILTVTVLVAGAFWFENNILKKPKSSNETTSTPQSFTKFSKVNFLDLPTYPSSWVFSNFTKEEAANTLVAGPEADADEDGLTNKQELFLESNPKLAKTFCVDPQRLCDRTDKEMFNTSRSPANGLPLPANLQFVIPTETLQNTARLQNTWGKTLAEKVPFLTTLIKAGNLDIDQKITQISVKTASTEESKTYNEEVLEVLKPLQDKDQLGLFLYVYDDETVPLAQKLQITNQMRDSFKNIKVPTRFIEFHRYYTVLLDDLVNVLENRQKIATNPADQDSIQKNNELWREVFYLMEQGNKLKKG